MKIMTKKFDLKVLLDNCERKKLIDLINENNGNHRLIQYFQTMWKSDHR